MDTNMKKNKNNNLSNIKKTFDKEKNVKPSSNKSKEYGGPKGLEPTRYGDWERKGLAVDF
ncbi:DUF1674 domain-containing protein [Alphaproteobacteria bacterium]|nr:DUF1674 domain-containing protein [Alphaproteobacteria bacterium]